MATIRPWYAPPIGWMRELKDVIGLWLVKHVVMPGAHNSGMSVIGRYTWFGKSYPSWTATAPRLERLPNNTNQFASPSDISSNTQNQAYNIYDQLRLGARWLDLRIINVLGDPTAGPFNFHTAHTTYSGMDQTPQHLGATGETMTEVVDRLNR